MRKIVLSIDAWNDLERVIEFLATKSPEAAARAQNTIADQLEKILLHPAMYRPVHDRPEERDAVIAFGSYGYILRYRHDQTADRVVVLRVWHQREQQ
jgi:plasmid stabilization system protein ParE